MSGKVLRALFVACRRHILRASLAILIGFSVYTQYASMRRAEVETAAASLRVSLPSATELAKSLVDNSNDSLEIPKFVHRMFKKDLRGGPWPNPAWEAAEQSWQRLFPAPEYTHFFWTDPELEAFFNESCPEFYRMYVSYSRDIDRSDISRYCILWRLGGIYADLDYEVRRNFFNELPGGRASLIQSPYKHEKFQNSLMASPAKHPYWQRLLKVAENLFDKCYFKVAKHLRSKEEKGMGFTRILPLPGCPKSETAFTGPELLETVPEHEDESMVYMLPCQSFQLATHLDDMDSNKTCGWLNESVVPDLNGIHWGTWTWTLIKKMGAGEIPDQSFASSSNTWYVFYRLHPDLWDPAVEVPKFVRIYWGMLLTTIKQHPVVGLVIVFALTVCVGLWLIVTLRPDLFSPDED